MRARRERRELDAMAGLVLRPVVGHVVAGTTAAIYNNTPAVSDLSLLQVGKHAQIIGAWRPDTNEVDIETVYAAAA